MVGSVWCSEAQPGVLRPHPEARWFFESHDAKTAGGGLGARFPVGMVCLR